MSPVRQSVILRPGAPMPTCARLRRSYLSTGASGSDHSGGGRPEHHQKRNRLGQEREREIGVRYGSTLFPCLIFPTP